MPTRPTPPPLQQLGASASKTDVAAKENEIKTQKYTEVVSLMSKDSQARPTESVLWAYLGQGQFGLKKYDDAETAFKKAHRARCRFEEAAP